MRKNQPHYHLQNMFTCQERESKKKKKRKNLIRKTQKHRKTINRFSTFIHLTTYKTQVCYIILQISEWLEHVFSMWILCDVYGTLSKTHKKKIIRTMSKLLYNTKCFVVYCKYVSSTQNKNSIRFCFFFSLISVRLPLFFLLQEQFTFFAFSFCSLPSIFE